MVRETTEIHIGSGKVGLLNLKEAFIEVQKKGFADRLRIMAELLRLVREDNYVPISAEQEYCNALYREFLRFQGADIPEETGFVEIQVLGPGCPRCEELERRVRNAIAELALPANIEHVRDLKRIADFGLVPTPGLVIRGKLVLAGKVPTVEELKKLLS